MRIAILSFPDAVPTSVVGPADILGSMIRTFPLLKGAPLNVSIEIDFITNKDGRYWRQAMGSPKAKKLTRQYNYDLVIVPAMFSNKISEVIQRESRLISWLIEQYSKQAQLASICVGAFLLAATGLLDGKKATTHWMFADQFRKTYPAVTLLDDKIIVDQGRVYTSGGAFSFTTLMMYLIDKLFGHEVAVTTSKIMMINMHQQPQNSFSIFQLQRDHTDEPIRQAQLYMEQHYPKAISLEKIAGQYNMSIRNFIRRFEQATHNTPHQYLQRVRIEAAKKMMENRNEGIEQIARQCGYEDMGFFRKIFKRHVDMAPREYLEKYGKGGLRQVTEI